MKTPEEIAAILQDEFDAADMHHADISEEQAVAIDYYEAKPLGNEVEGLSQVVLPDVAEVCDYMLISVMRAFVSGDKVVEFSAKEPEDEDVVEEITEAMNYVFMRGQDGYRVLNDWLQSGLIEKYGVVKTSVAKEERVRKEFAVMPAEGVALLQAQGIEPDDVVDMGDGTYKVTVTRTTARKRFVDVTVPSEEFRFSARARHEDDAGYLAHVCRKTRSELVEMGFDRDQVYNLGDNDGFVNDTRANARDDYWFNDDGSSAAVEQLLLCEEYARIDVDDDGIAERVKVFRVGNEILIDAKTGEPAIEVVDDQPFVVFTPFPRAHRLIGNGLADKAIDLQAIRSMIARQFLDGLRLANMPRPVVDMSQTTNETIDDLLSPIPGAPIRTKGGVGAVQPFNSGFNVGNSLGALEFFAGERETRCGVTRLNQGLDAETLNKTATGAALMQAQGQQVEEYIARNFAECFARLMVKKARLMREEGEPLTIKVNGQFKQIDPSMWPDEMDMNIAVGLGSNNKDKRIQARMLLLNIQKEGLQAGLVDNAGIFKNADGLVRDMGIGKGADFFIDPETAPQGERPDPAMAAEQAKAMLEAERIDADKAKAEAQMELERLKAEAAVELQREKHRLEMEAAREKNALEAQLQRDKAAAEIGLAEAKAQAEIELAQRKAAIEAAAIVNIPDQHMGGSLAV